MLLRDRPWLSDISAFGTIVDPSRYHDVDLNAYGTDASMKEEI